MARHQFPYLLFQLFNLPFRLIYVFLKINACVLRRSDILHRNTDPLKVKRAEYGIRFSDIRIGRHITSVHIIFILHAL